MGTSAAALLADFEGGKGYATPYSQIRDLQLAALNERFAEQAERIKLVAFRAEQAGIGQIARLEDIVPLLLPHTAYKSYPESFLAERKWDRLTKWLGTVSAHRIDGVDLEGVTDIDDWLSRLEQAGHFVSCSSGTTGNPAMLISSQADMDWVCRDIVQAFAWGSGVKPAQDRLIFGLAPMARVARNTATGEALRQAFGIPGKERYRYPVPAITIGSITRMITLRKAIADGSARPAEIAEFEATSAARQELVDQAAGASAEALIAVRQEKLYISGMWATLYKVAEEVRSRGYEGKDFHPENTCFVAGGLKGTQLPSDYLEFDYETFNLSPERNYQMYSMQELGSSMPRCQKGGRYHVPPWIVVLPLDKAGDALLPGVGQGEIEGRAALFDLSLDGSWGGIISG
jgi:hypothetical protein